MNLRCASGSVCAFHLQRVLRAMTMKGGSSWYVCPSTVTCRSSMHSSSAAWVLDGARLISSPSTMLENTAWLEFELAVCGRKR